MQTIIMRANKIWNAMGTLHWAEEPDTQNLGNERISYSHLILMWVRVLQCKVDPLHRGSAFEGIFLQSGTTYITKNGLSSLYRGKKKRTHETIIPKVMRLPSTMMRLPRFAAGEHSAWYEGTVDVWTAVSFSTRNKWNEWHLHSIHFRPLSLFGQPLVGNN